MFSINAIIVSFLFFSCASYKDVDKRHGNYFKEVYTQSSDSPYPNQNFLFLKRSIVDKTSEEGEEYPISSASGIAIKDKQGKVYGLTAAHWCVNTEGDEYESFVKHMFGYDSLEEANQNTKNRTDFYGKTYDIVIMALDKEKDLCLFSFESKYASKIKDIKVASKSPKIGDKIYTVSAPQAVGASTIRLHFEGSYSGCTNSTNENECFYTVPGVIGSSGSGILNEDGELVGILNFTIIGFNNVTGGPSTLEIKEFILKELP